MLQLWIAIALLVAGLALFAKRLYHRRQAALPGGTAIASDTAEHPSPILISRRYGLKGRPDALQTPAGVISGQRGRQASATGPITSGLSVARVLNAPIATRPSFDLSLQKPNQTGREKWIFAFCCRPILDGMRRPVLSGRAIRFPVNALD
jgi:hypothetical protein